MTLLYRVPRLIETKYGERRVFEIIVDDSDYDFTVNEKSPLYRYFIRSLADTKKDTELVLVRTGNGKSTRYSVKEAQGSLQLFSRARELDMGGRHGNQVGARVSEFDPSRRPFRWDDHDDAARVFPRWADNLSIRVSS